MPDRLPRQPGERYYIHKASRGPTGRPYAGVTCERVGVVPRWYADRAEAEADAARMSAWNPVGFEVADDLPLDRDTLSC